MSVDAAVTKDLVEHLPYLGFAPMVSAGHGSGVSVRFEADTVAC